MRTTHGAQNGRKCSMETNGNRNDAKWDEFEKMMEDKVVFTVPIDESVKAGVVTSLKGVRAFIPASQLSTSYVEDTNEWIGKEIDVVIITADREKQRLVLSGREAAKIKRSQEKKARIDALAVGTVLEGKVETIKPYGAFVDLGNGISGLVHISQMSTKRVATPEEVCKEGDVVKVKVTKVKDGKVSLSMRALEEAPAPAEDDIPELSSVVSHEKATTSLGDLLKNIKLD
ncbi:MAG: S1 RNA-binding domain-containing protein [Lachnospiraceae bacterium]|nr:S1 RNA-binding domain-containing protein [Lachnospiraceae bacterium]